MTCKEKLIADHPEWTKEEIDYRIHENCPSDYRYLDVPVDCVVEHSTCIRCWNRKIPETTEVKKEKENMSTTRKTKQELVEEIDALKKELETVKNVEQYEEGAYQIKALHTAFMNAGFTDAQAFELILTMYHTNSNINLAAGAARTHKF